MAIVGTTIFSHILPVIFGFFGIVMIISGSLEKSNSKLALGVILFIMACVFPYIIFRVLI